MNEAFFFYNTTTQRPDRRKPPSAHSNISVHSTAQSITHIFSSNKSRSQSQRSHSSSTSIPIIPTVSNSSPKNSKSLFTLTPATSTDSFHDSRDRMPSTPLIDYKHSANQSSKTSSVLPSQRKSSSTSGSNPESKNALQSAESRAPAIPISSSAKSSSMSSTTDSTGLTSPYSPSKQKPPFSKRHGRRYLRDSTIIYPLPCDLTELHRQTLRTILMCQVFNGPVCSQAFVNKAPERVLEIACGTGFWSVMCHRHFSQRGFADVSFTGLDVAPLAPRMEDEDMNWRFIQHDLRRLPLPFRDDEFDLLMIKDTSLVTQTLSGYEQSLMDEYLRILKPGGVMEIWEGDSTLRMLLPHSSFPTKDDDNESEDKEQVHANAMATYAVTQQTPFAAPQNQYLMDYNTWITTALETRRLTAMPCTIIQPMLIQESDSLAEVEYRRLAIPLGEVRWEREGVGGAVAQGPNGAPSKGKAKEPDRRLLTAEQAALRRTALMTVVQMIESLEPLLREASGKGQDEWDRWHGNMMNDLMNSNGTSWGECLEVGAWWARKKKPAS